MVPSTCGGSFGASTRTPSGVACATCPLPREEAVDDDIDCDNEYPENDPISLAELFVARDAGVNDMVSASHLRRMRLTETCQ